MQKIKSGKGGGKDSIFSTEENSGQKRKEGRGKAKGTYRFFSRYTRKRRTRERLAPPCLRMGKRERKEVHRMATEHGGGQTQQTSQIGGMLKEPKLSRGAKNTKEVKFAQALPLRRRRRTGRIQNTQYGEKSS